MSILNQGVVLNEVFYQLILRFGNVHVQFLIEKGSQKVDGKLRISRYYTVVLCSLSLKFKDVATLKVSNF